MKRGLRYRFGVIAVTLILMVSITLSFLLLLQQKQGFQRFVEESRESTEVYLQEQVRQRGVSLVSVLAENITNSLYSMDMEALLLTLEATKSSPDITDTLVYDRNGMIIHDGEDLIPRYGQRISHQDSLTAIEEKNKTVLTFKNGDLLISQSIWIGDTPLGGVQLVMSLAAMNQRLAEQEQQENILYESTLNSFYQLALTTTLILAFTGISISFMLSRRIVKPIEKVASAAKHIAENDFSTQLHYESRDEIGALVNTFNEMSHTLQQEIHRREKTEEKLRHQALYDSVTGLPNRDLVLDRLAQSIDSASREQTKTALAFLDLDDFKKINDTLGHSAGDELLIQAAHRLQSIVRPTDTVSRIGGDEFVVLITGLKSTTETSPVIEKLLAQFREPFSLEGRSIMLTASIGIAIFPDDGDCESTLLRKADAAMYHSKDMGRNTYSYFTDEMNEQVMRRLLIEEQIQSGLKNNEFTVLYQPKIRLSDYSVTSAEALLRWHNPELGNVSLGEFIPIAEQTGLITDLGNFVLQEALNDLSHWKTLNSNFSVSVNISPRQFRDADLPEKLSALVEKHMNTAEGLELEITEGVLMSGQAIVGETLTRIRKEGVLLSMDDFGTGYSALNYVRQYPFDLIKIDQSFVRDIETDPEDCALIKATVAMAHALNLKVVAEGVETAEQLEFLETIGCDYVQGFYFSKALPADKIDLFFTKEQFKELAPS